MMLHKPCVCFLLGKDVVIPNRDRFYTARQKISPHPVAKTTGYTSQSEKLRQDPKACLAINCADEGRTTWTEQRSIGR